MTGVKENSQLRIAALFLDIRNSTIFVDNYDEDRVCRTLDTLFSKSREQIENDGGKVDKILGDGLLSTFDDENPSESAVNAAISIQQRVVPETEAKDGFNSIDIGIGIATGDVIRTNLAGIDTTVVGRPVNLAARLESLCKRYDLAILTDETTHEEVHHGSIPEDHKVRQIPEQTIRGIQKSETVYNICDTDYLSESYIKTFNKGMRKYINKDYEAALSEFTEAYTRNERYNDQILLNELANKCLESLRTNQDLYWNPDRYEKHSTTVVQQSYRLREMVSQSISSWETRPTDILDVGCLTGNVTERVLKDKLFSDTKIKAIDPSKENIDKARAKHRGSDPKIEYIKASIDKYSPKEELGKYDVIFSNSTLHLINNQKKAYENLRKLIHPDGLLAVHQGGQGSYQELHEVVLELIDRYNWRHYFDNLDIPLGLIYHSEDEMKSLLNQTGFVSSQFEFVEKSAPETIIEDFAEASLNRYIEHLENDAQREVLC